ncbi:MAG: hypothetical protein KDD66_02650 [Bdellovibrionales bacterium]|nr:hypothetical protein [Bdellovibrionales bacterium]
MAYRQHQSNVIFCDTLITVSSKTQRLKLHRDGVKSGILFPGCIFGLTGSLNSARAFITAFREVTADKTGSPARLWNSFVDFCCKYEFDLDPEEAFQLILSSRASGKPKFYFFDSLLGFSAPPECDDKFLMGFGSGVATMEELIQETIIPKYESMESIVDKMIENQPISSEQVFPYLLSLWLSEFSLTFESSKLRAASVGGPFHFVAQTAHSEAPQQPAAYFFLNPNLPKKEIYADFFRVVPVANGVYIESMRPERRRHRELYVQASKSVFFDTMTRPDASYLSNEEMLSEVKEMLSAMPFFCFSGFGFTDPRLRHTSGFIFTNNGKREELFTKDGKPSPWLQSFLTHAMEQLRNSNDNSNR